MLGSKNKKTRSHLFRDNCGLSVTPAACESDFSAHSLILYRGSQSVNGDLREFSRFLGGPLRVRLHATYQVINKSRLFNPSGRESVELCDRRLAESQCDLDTACGWSSGSWSFSAVGWFAWHADSFMLSPQRIAARKSPGGVREDSIITRCKSK